MPRLSKSIKAISLFVLISTLEIVGLISPNQSWAGIITSPGSTLAYARATLGQSFTMPANASGTLSTLFVAGIRGRGPSNVVCVQAKVYTSSAKTTLLETSSNSVCDTDASGTEMTGTAPTGSFNFAGTTNLAAGTQYFFELSVTSGESAFWTNQDYNATTGGSYSGGQLFADGSYKPSYDMAFTLNYVDGPDLIPPTFTTSNSFNFAENTAISSTAAIIKVSESATIVLSGGPDSSLFNLTTTDSITVSIKFKASPDYENPLDSGGNNVYDLVLLATDAANNATTQNISISVTDVLDTSAFNFFSLAGNATSAVYRSSIQINASVTVSSKITFKVNGKPISGCVSKAATGSGSSFTVSCSWSPSIRGILTLTASSTPYSGAISGAYATPITVGVVNRTNKR